VVSDPQPLPALLDTKVVMRELGVTRGVAESLMRECPKVIVGRRVFVKREDVAAVIRARTVEAGAFPVRVSA
jgi:hypothetical protein